MVIEIHYNAFQTIKEQIPKEYEVKDIELLEELKDDIIMLYVYNILTEKPKDDAIKRLHKQVIKNLKRKDESK